MCEISKTFILVITIIAISLFGMILNAFGEDKIDNQYLGKFPVNGILSNYIFVSKMCINGYTYIVVQDVHGISVTQAMFSGVNGTLPLRCKNTSKVEEDNDEE